MDAVHLSKFIIAKCDNAGDLLTNKKLQKLLYYIEAWALVHMGSIIDDDFEAWVHGPVIPSVYQEYKKFGYSPIRITYPGDMDSTAYLAHFNIDPQYVTLIEQVLQKYGGLSSYQLEHLSHRELPWVEARQNLSPVDNCSTLISKATIKDYYTSLIAN